VETATSSTHTCSEEKLATLSLGFTFLNGLLGSEAAFYVASAILRMARFPKADKLFIKNLKRRKKEERKRGFHFYERATNDGCLFMGCLSA